MIFKELYETKKVKSARKVLREHYDVNVDFDRMSMRQAKSALQDIRKILSKVRNSSAIYESQQKGSYMKMLMLEQGLMDRIKYLNSVGSTLVFENEEVQKSQVILSAQDMIDTLQKMLEQISKMNVEELNAVVDGVRNEFGSETAESFNSNVGATLSQLQQNITEAKNSLTQSLGELTGEAPAMDADMMQPQDQAQPDDVEPDQEILGPTEVPDEEEQDDIAPVGRERR